MPRIFDNIDESLLGALQESLRLARRADFCVGYFNLRGWSGLGPIVDERFDGSGESCLRLLVGMHGSAADELRSQYSLRPRDEIDFRRASKLKQKVIEDFREQLTIGAPTTADEIGLRRLARQLRTGRLLVKLYVRAPLHAKLYLIHREDYHAPIVGYLGSSNLTFAGLVKQGELNIDVLDNDATTKLQNWFDDRWNDKFCLDITEDLAKVLETSWARESIIPPYHIYLNIAYHLSQEARSGLAEFRIPRIFGNKLFDYQAQAVRVAARYLNDERRRGVILGDVVGLGKTLMATALAKIFEDDKGLETLIICPKNLVNMWEDYVHRYHLHAKVMSITMVAPRQGSRRQRGGDPGGLEDLRRYRLVILDESHNLRNPQGARYQAIRDYIDRNGSRCILLSATPYNKAYVDLAAQLALFVDDHQDLGVRPDRLLAEVGEAEFLAHHQCPVRSLAAFEKSKYPDDWRELMRLYMVRRTRGFIRENFAKTDPENGRSYLILEDGNRTYFPDRVPKTIRFEHRQDDPNDPYARLYAQSVVDKIRSLKLPRYGLGLYVDAGPGTRTTPAEDKIIQDLSRAGKRLMGFCRTNLFKRLESCGHAFLQSLERHILRNAITLYALENGLEVPIGTSDPGMLDTATFDDDSDQVGVTGSVFDEENEDLVDSDAETVDPEGFDLGAYLEQAQHVYNGYRTRYRNRFKWLRADLFHRALRDHLREDAEVLGTILREHGAWVPAHDQKLESLWRLLSKDHSADKVLVFTQFADTVEYLVRELKQRGLTAIEGVTGQSEDPTAMAFRFSPISNEVRDRVSAEREIRVLVATDVLSEGQNLQDAHVVVNFDLPWAIIRLIQRAGRVDRIGQSHPKIFCYSFYPMEGVDRILNLRDRVRQRLTENGEVVGADEQFFEDLQVDPKFRDLYHERAGVLDGDDDSEVDLASQALQIWKSAIDADPSLKAAIENLPDVVFSAKHYRVESAKPAGVLVYLRTPEGNDALGWVDERGEPVTESPSAILRAAECEPDTLAVPKATNHHDLVRTSVGRMIHEDSQVGGQLGRPNGARYKTYHRLLRYRESVAGTLLAEGALDAVIEEIYRYPLRPVATDTLNRQLKVGIEDDALAALCHDLRRDGRLCVVGEDQESEEPRIICSLGLVASG